MDNRDNSTENVSSQSQLMRQVEDVIIFGRGPGSEYLKGATRRAPEAITADMLKLARLFAMATGLDIDFRAAADTDEAKEAFGELFLILARAAEQAVYA